MMPQLKFGISLVDTGAQCPLCVFAFFETFTISLAEYDTSNSLVCPQLGSRCCSLLASFASFLDSKLREKSCNLKRLWASWFVLPDLETQHDFQTNASPVCSCRGPIAPPFPPNPPPPPYYPRTAQPDMPSWPPWDSMGVMKVDGEDLSTETSEIDMCVNQCTRCICLCLCLSQKVCLVEWRLDLQELCSRKGKFLPRLWVYHMPY